MIVFDWIKVAINILKTLYSIICFQFVFNKMNIILFQGLLRSLETLHLQIWQLYYFKTFTKIVRNLKSLFFQLGIVFVTFVEP